jgi:predicted lipoprotein with Yx(FWY)xxD motif
MNRIAVPRTPVVVLAVAVGLVAAFFAVRSAVASAKAPSRVVAKTAHNAKLRETVLVTPKGLTLYSLSVERRGRFICTNSFCLSLWTPLVVPKGTHPIGASGLGTIKRPDGRVQVTFRGGPLYTFVEDHRRGDVKGNGFKDVGTWHAASPAKGNGSPAPPSNGGYGGYGG